MLILLVVLDDSTLLAADSIVVKVCGKPTTGRTGEMEGFGIVTGEAPVLDRHPDTLP